MKTYEQVALRAGTMLSITCGREHDFWMGYNAALIDSQKGRDLRIENDGWRNTNSPDKSWAARCRGYAAGLNWRMED